MESPNDVSHRTYDALDRLTTSTRPGATTPGWLWTYDKVGNRLVDQKADTSGVAASLSSYNATNQLTSRAAGGSIAVGQHQRGGAQASEVPPKGAPLIFARFTVIAACLLSVACSAYRAGLVLNEAGQAQATGNFNEALRLYGEVSRLDPGQPAGPYGRGLALRELGRPKEALVAFREAMRVDPRFRFAHLELAITQSDLGSLGESAATLKAALARFPGDPDLEAEQRRLQAIQGSLHPRQ